VVVEHAEHAEHAEHVEHVEHVDGPFGPAMPTNTSPKNVTAIFSVQSIVAAYFWWLVTHGRASRSDRHFALPWVTAHCPNMHTKVLHTQHSSRAKGLDAKRHHGREVAFVDPSSSTSTTRMEPKMFRRVPSSSTTTAMVAIIIIINTEKCNVHLSSKFNNLELGEPSREN
jgi:hypothetical protein